MASSNKPENTEDEDAYSHFNQRFTYICSSLIGATVSVELDDGSVFEGLFRTFSPDFDITLDHLHRVNPDDPTRINPETVSDLGVFSMKKIIKCVALDVDLNHAKDGFMTDAQISGGGGKMNGERELVSWVPDGDEDDHGGFSLELDANEANGWRAEDMFKANEENYGVTSTFKASLEGYTHQITLDKNSEEYKYGQP